MGFWLLVVFVAFVLIVAFSALSLGFDICGDPECDPPQNSEHKHQGKQFDHFPLHPIISKSNTLFYLYVCKGKWSNCLP